METVRLREAAQFDAARMKKTNIFETPRFFLDVYGFEPGQEQKPHTHDRSDKVYYVLEGAGKFQVGAVEKVLTAGEAVWAPAGELHGVVNTGPDRLVVIAFMAPHPRYRPGVEAG